MSPEEVKSIIDAQGDGPALSVVMDGIDRAAFVAGQSSTDSVSAGTSRYKGFVVGSWTDVRMRSSKPVKEDTTFTFLLSTGSSSSAAPKTYRTVSVTIPKGRTISMQGGDSQGTIQLRPDMEVKTLMPVEVMQPVISTEGNVGSLATVSDVRISRWASPRTNDDYGRLLKSSIFPSEDPDRIIIRLPIPEKTGQGRVKVHISTTGSQGTPISTGYSYDDEGADVTFKETSPGQFESLPIVIVADQDDDQWAGNGTFDGNDDDPTFIGWPGGKIVCSGSSLGARTHEFPIRRFTHKFKIAPILTGPIRLGDADAILQFFARTPEIYAPLHVKMESQSLGTLSSDQWASEMPDGKVHLGNVLTIAGWVDQLGYDSDTIKIVFVDKNYNDADDLNGDDSVTFAQTWYTKGRPDLIFVYLKYLQNDDATYLGHVPAHEIGHVLRGIGHTTVAGDYVDGTEAETGSRLQKYHVMNKSGNMFGFEGEKSKHWMLTDLNYIRRRTPYAIPINP